VRLLQQLLQLLCLGAGAGGWLPTLLLLFGLASSSITWGLCQVQTHTPHWSSIACAPGGVVAYYSLEGGVEHPVQVEGHAVCHDHCHREVAQPPAGMGTSSTCMWLQSVTATPGG
jgi:hypothetical protein